MTDGRVKLLLLPTFGLLALVFIGPLIWFFADTLAQLADRPDGNVAGYVAKVLTSRAVTRSFLMTIEISVIVTLAALIISYPLAYYLTRAGKVAFNIVILCIVVPYFTSVIVRTYAWMVLLGNKGLVNQGLEKLGLISKPIALLYNQTGILIGMTYVLMPYMVLTLYAAMKTIDPRLMQAAEGMGAGRMYAFWKVYFPMTMRGVVAGGLIVFILSLGYFITPALMGGPGNVMVAMQIQNEVEINLNWPLAAILSLALLGATLILFWLYIRIAGLKSLIGEDIR